jgi:hypothetical protein
MFKQYIYQHFYIGDSVSVGFYLYSINGFYAECSFVALEVQSYCKPTTATVITPSSLSILLCKSPAYINIDISSEMKKGCSLFFACGPLYTWNVMASHNFCVVLA